MDANALASCEAVLPKAGGGKARLHNPPKERTGTETTPEAYI